MNANNPMKILHSPDVGLLIIRVGVGVVGVYHGAQKLFGAWGGPGIPAFAEMLGKMNVPMPVVSAWAAGLGEFAGGILVALGFLPRIGALWFALTMLVAWGHAHHFSFDHNSGGSDYPFFIMVVCLGIIFAGPGQYSATALMTGKRNP